MNSGLGGWTRVKQRVHIPLTRVGDGKHSHTHTYINAEREEAVKENNGENPRNALILGCCFAARFFYQRHAIFSLLHDNLEYLGGF